MRNWDDLRVFLATARAESLTGAGRDLRMDPATVGRRVARLEEGLGATLFAKSPQGYALTEAGQKLMTHAEAAEAALRAGTGEASGAGEGLSGTIRIGAPDGCANYLLPQVCARIAEAHPALDIQILALPRVVNLSRREADLAIAVSRPKTDRLRAEALSEYRLSLAASDDWIARHGAPTSPADLKGARMIGYIPDMIFDAELDYLSALGVAHVPLASNSISVQLNLARAGAGLAVVHDFALPFAPELRRVLPGEVALTRTFWLVSHAGPRDARLDRVARLLRDGMRAELARLEAAVA
ncbi:LysR family transcriptional regulator [Roseibacterium beibuensis]|uniref:LysR family transcriptional regulator n=1 Tax=[Roseibacterium] beibuensis TaxID=1193142 RepID=A0ABP9L3M7_9RHOB|nr:LysR family transcriptional regulator [Roseibacterium beibuensis]MCS6621581.1 LysR family transcriptional regulator [Roseibacterium beibuensis]